MATASLLSYAESRLNKTRESLHREINTVRTGSATPSLLENVLVNYHGIPTPINQLATVTAPEARLLVLQPWDRSVISEIERSILKSSLGLNPANDGTAVRIPIPEPTEERRRDLVKVVRRNAEESRVAVRNIRRDAIEKIRAMERNKELSQDESRRNQDQIQKLTDSYIGKVDTAAAEKEAEVLEV